jgi:hypothetical protein
VQVVEQAFQFFKYGTNCYFKNINAHTEVHLPTEIFEKYSCDKKMGQKMIVQLTDFNTLKVFPTHK